MDIVKIALTPPPWVLGHLRGTFAKKMAFFKKCLKQFGFGLDPPSPPFGQCSNQSRFFFMGLLPLLPLSSEALHVFKTILLNKLILPVI